MIQQRRTVVDTANAAVNAGIERDSVSQGGFSASTLTSQADIPNFIRRIRFHKTSKVSSIVALTAINVISPK
jgi:hypothetical protein